jgi:hypothetical protein
MLASGVVFKLAGGAVPQRLTEDQANAQPGALNPDYGFIPPDLYFPTSSAKLSQYYGLYVVRRAGSESKNNKNYERSRNVIENKQNADILPPQLTCILVEMTRIVGHFCTNRHESSDILYPNDANRRLFATK